jgi:hypothetical protein
MVIKNHTLIYRYIHTILRSRLDVNLRFVNLTTNQLDFDEQTFQAILAAMGNNQHRYLSNNDAVEIIGSERWTELRVKLDKNGYLGIDYELFAAILHSRYERMVSVI